MWRICSALVYFIALVRPGFADVWNPPKPFDAVSPNGRYVVHVTPACTSPWYWLDGDATRCTATLVERLAGGKETEVWSGHLSNKAAPVDALVSDDGRYVVTLDNWYHIGYESNVVAVYGARGESLVEFSLEQLLSPTELERVVATMTCRMWRRGAWIDSASSSVILVGLPGGALYVQRERAGTPMDCTDRGALRALNLRTGELRPGTDDDIRAGLTHSNAETVSLALDLASERRISGCTHTALALLSDNERPLGIRLRSANLLAWEGVRSGVSLMKAVASRSYTGATEEDQAYALHHLRDLEPPEELH